VIDEEQLRSQREARALRAAELEAVERASAADRGRALRRVAAGFAALAIGVVGFLGMLVDEAHGAWTRIAVTGLAIGAIAITVGALELTGAAEAFARIPRRARDAFAIVVIIAIVAALGMAVRYELSLF
jgi:hypothetical protein